MTKATKAIKKTVKTVIPLIFLMKWASFLVEVLATKDLTYKQEGHKTMVAEFEIELDIPAAPAGTAGWSLRQLQIICKWLLITI